MVLSFNGRVWSGDPTTVDEARMRYRQDPGGELLPFASVLYSFKHKSACAEELYGLRERLGAKARYLYNNPPVQHDGHQFADQADMLATFLHWIGRASDDLGQRERFMVYAKKAISEGLGYAPSSGPRMHTRALLFLTLAAIDLDQGERFNARVNLGCVVELAAEVQDANQRARVYRKLGLLLRKSGSWFEGMRWSIRACWLSGLPRDVRFKNLGGLLGIGN
jgi:hypothetical protein